MKLLNSKLRDETPVWVRKAEAAKQRWQESDAAIGAAASEIEDILKKIPSGYLSTEMINGRLESRIEAVAHHPHLRAAKIRGRLLLDLLNEANAKRHAAIAAARCAREEYESLEAEIKPLMEELQTVFHDGIEARLEAIRALMFPLIFRFSRRDDPWSREEVAERAFKDLGRVKDLIFRRHRTANCKSNAADADAYFRAILHLEETAKDDLGE